MFIPSGPVGPSVIIARENFRILVDVERDEENGQDIITIKVACKKPLDDTLRQVRGEITGHLLALLKWDLDLINQRVGMETEISAPDDVIAEAKTSLERAALPAQEKIAEIMKKLQEET
jgi:hypothetical protein